MTSGAAPYYLGLPFRRKVHPIGDTNQLALLPFSACMQLWEPPLTVNSIGTDAAVTMPLHIYAKGNVKVQLEVLNNITVGIDATAQLGIDLDTANDGFGGADHAVMLDVDATPVVDIFNGKIKFAAGPNRKAAVHWKVQGSSAHLPLTCHPDGHCLLLSLLL